MSRSMKIFAITHTSAQSSSLDTDLGPFHLIPPLVVQLRLPHAQSTHPAHAHAHTMHTRSQHTLTHQRIHAHDTHTHTHTHTQHTAMCNDMIVYDSHPCAGPNAPATPCIELRGPKLELASHSLPVVISVPHGGTLEPAGYPDRDCATSGWECSPDQ